MRWLLVVLVLAGAACGGNGAHGGHDMGGVRGPERDVPDAFLKTDCDRAQDCDDGNPCTIDTCALTHRCAHTTRDCSALTTPKNHCSVGACDPVSGACVGAPANEGDVCDVTANTPGTCVAGGCTPVAQCAGGLFVPSLDCSFERSASSTLSGTSKLDSYACATHETGPETAYHMNLSQQRTVTIALDATTDLDLIVLEGKYCIAAAPCAAFSTTAGSGKESVTFTARADIDYTIVVEGANGAAGSFNLNVTCEGCKPITTLACNMTVMGDTSGSKSTSNFDSWSCDGTTPGPEDSYHLQPSMDTNVKLKLSGLSQDLDLLVVYDSSGQCDPSSCAGSSANVGTGDESVSFSASSFSSYDVVVESKMFGGPYQLEIDCPQSCAPNALTLSCSTPSDSRRSDDPSHATSLVSGWMCDANTGGPEVVYRFSPSTSGMYTIDLTGLSADLDLVVTTGTYNFCDAASACVAQSANTGTASESVTFQADAFKYYYIAVDGKNGAISNFDIKLKSSVCPPPSCYNWENSISCASPKETLRNDDTTRSKNVADAWACDPNTTGPEIVYRFQPPNTGMYTVELTGLAADLDLIVVEGSDFACDPSVPCVASSVTAGTADEKLSFLGDSSKYYWIAVDGKAGAASSYNIKLTSASCPGPSCYNSNDLLSCSIRDDWRRNDDAARSKNAVDTWMCDANANGPEVVYKFTPAAAGMYTVTLDGLSADLDLVVLQNASAYTCDSASSCVTSSVTAGSASESVSWQADTAHTYYVAVDGKAGAVSSYHIRLDGAACGPATCTNGYRSLSCSGPVLYNRNDASGGTSDVSSWGGATACDTGTTGPEFAHYFQPPAAGSYTVEMIGQKADLDLIVMETSSSSSCDPNAHCVAASHNGSIADERLTFQAAAGKSYYLVVDGVNGAVSPYALAIVDGCP